MIHAALGASAAHRWMVCPGSLRLLADIPSRDTKYTIEGTSAHTLAQMSLEKNLPPKTWEGSEINGVPVTEEMVEAVTVYVEDISSAYDSLGSLRFIEQRFDLSPLNPPGPMFGTGDVVIYDPFNRTLRVMDFKYGQGVVVEVEGNVQLMFYALGALLELRKTIPDPQIDYIEMTVCQPRAPHPDGIVRRWTITRQELRDFGKLLLEAARATLPEDAPLVAGDSQCRFCDAKAICPAIAKRAQEVALVEFTDLPEHVPPVPETMPEDLLQDVMNHAHILEDWLRAVRDHVFARLESGGEFNGWKLVAKRANRKWVSDEATYQWAERQGLDRDEITAGKLLSPAQMDKFCKKLRIEVPSELAENPSTGYTLAPDYDVRPPILTEPETDFASLPAGSDTPNGGEETGESK